jgi:hypothetical protein
MEGSATQDGEVAWPFKLVFRLAGAIFCLLQMTPAMAENLFEPLGNVQNASQSEARKGVQRLGMGHLNVQAMQQLFDRSSGHSSQVSQIPLPLLDGSESMLQLRGQPSNGRDGIQVLGGLVDGQGHNLATLTNDNGNLMGRIWKDGKLFSVEGDARGLYQLTGIQRSGIPRAKKSLGPEDVSFQLNPMKKETRQEAGEQIDLLVYVSERAANELGGRDKARQYARLLVAEANSIFQRSGIGDDSILRLVKMRINPLDEDNDPVKNIKHWMTFKPFIADRNEVGADLVVFIAYPEKPRFCGTAFRGPEEYDSAGYPELGYSLATFNCLRNDLSFTRGLGRNLGAGYERIIENQRGHSFGYVNVPKKWQTIMAFGFDCYEAHKEFCKELPYFSNPQLSYEGDPMGFPQSDKRSADNAAAIRANRALIAAYRSGPKSSGGGRGTSNIDGIVIEDSSIGARNAKAGKERKIKW